MTEPTVIPPLDPSLPPPLPPPPHLTVAALAHIRALSVDGFSMHPEIMVRMVDDLLLAYEQKASAYVERNKCVALAARMAQLLGCPVWLGVHDPKDKTWEDDWRSVVFIELPTGQVSWHLHDSDRDTFQFLDRKHGPRWDGHSTKLKYERVARATQPRYIGTHDWPIHVGNVT